VARALDGSTQRFSAAAQPITAYPFTVAGWSYPTNTTAGSADKYIFSLSNNSGTTLFSGLQWLDANAKLAAFISTSGTVRKWDTTATATLNTWQHVAGVFTSASDIVAYVNADGAGAYTNTGSPTVPTWNTVSIGALVRSSVAGWYYGSLAETGLWNVALTQAELDQLAAGYSPLFVRPQSLVAYWPLFGRATDEEDWDGAYPLTNTGSATVADHPRIIYPRRRGIVVPVAAASGPTVVALTPTTIGSTSHRPRYTWTPA
jgi:hypothetical protein